MENKNSKITEEYKAEITGILSRISQDLGESVIKSIEPKISSFTTSLDHNFKNIHEINNKQKANFEKASDFFNTLDDKVSTFSEKLSGDELSEKITTDIKVFEQNFIKDNRSIKEEVINEIHKGSSQVKELISQQKEVEIILQNLKNINSQQSVLLESFEGKANFTNENLSEIKKSIDVSNGKIEKEKLILNNAITANNKLIEQTRQGTEKLIVNQLLSFTTKISDINNNQLKTQLKESQLKQERTDKFIYFLTFIIVIVLVLTLLLLFK
jgi:hypothetical protein